MLCETYQILKSIINFKDNLKYIMNSCDCLHKYDIMNIISTIKFIICILRDDIR